MQQYYTGVGSRKTPDDILALMERIAMHAAHKGVTLRSGGALGADSAFETGCSMGAKEIYLAHHATPKAMSIAAQFHPVWHKLPAYVQKLHGRNAFQVLGMDLKTPSQALVCWTPDGCISHTTRSIKTGGTGTAISIAEAYKVPVYNLRHATHVKCWEDWLNT